MRSIIPGSVREKFDEITAKFGTSFPLDIVIEIVKNQRKRPLYLRNSHLCNGISGYALALIDADVITINSSIDNTRRSVTILHECSHFLLDHVKITHCTYKKFVFAQNKFVRKILFHEPITSYDNPIEYAAETLAMMLFECVQIYEGSLPSEIMSMYGYEI